MENISSQVANIFTKIKKGKPLIHHITNFVVMNDTANVTLHLGALPVMAHAQEEMEEMVNIASALIINIGTLSNTWVESMLMAGKRANKRGIPIILDVVGAGATSYRTEVCRTLLQKLHISVVKGNAGEIGILSGAGGEVKGVESVGETKNINNAVSAFAKKHQTTVVITGKRDIIIDGHILYGVDNGDFWLTTNTGTGCMSTTVVGVFCAVEKDYALASAAALATFGLAAEIAAKNAKGPASFKIALLDSLYNMNEEALEKKAKVIKLENKS